MSIEKQGTLGFPKQGDLAGVVGDVLDDAVEENVERLWFGCWGGILEAVGGKGENRPLERALLVVKTGEYVRPGMRCGRPIFFGSRVTRLGGREALTPDAKPGGDVQDQLRNRVRARDGARGGLLFADAFQEFFQSRAMPGRAMVHTAELIGDAGEF